MKRSIRAFMIILCCFFLSGCWSSKEMSDLAFVTAVGISKDKDENKYKVSLQVVNPGSVAGGQQASVQDAPVTIMSSTAFNPFEASRHVTSKMSRNLYYAHTNLIVIDEELARTKGLYELFDFIERSDQLRETATIVIAKGTSAENVIKNLTPIDRIPAVYVNKMLKNAEDNGGQNIKVTVDEVLQKITSQGREPIINGISIQGSAEEGSMQESIQGSDPKGKLEASGIAIFREGKLIDWVKGYNVHGILWTTNKVKDIVDSIDWENHKKAIALQTIRAKSKLDVKWKHGRPIILINIETEGNINGVNVSVDLRDPQVIQKIESLWEKQIEQEVMKTVKRAKKDKSDIFGFGRTIYEHSPKKWKELKDDWNVKGFTEVDVDVNVNAFIRRTGLRNQPFLSNPNR
ncbi:Ger(x)C family spore germination protein [Priestia endophytica]|uniref:Ger(x)C family spore germination protein n=1 Tax=Priestia endophytica TaxID=135735 RepID=UPI001559B10F|nr:Ger(x)C family spore germination protein [Priestia endophytica]